MTNKEAELVKQLTEVAMIVAELKAENKILKDINEKLMQTLKVHDVAGQREQLKCQCEKAIFTRTVDAEFNPLCGRCGKIV